MAEWIFDGYGAPTLIFDGDCIRDGYGDVIAWINGINVYGLYGGHKGWFEKGVLYDSDNEVLGFIRSRTGHLPSIPGLQGTPGMPGFSGKPGRPGMAMIPGRPGYSGWSNFLLSSYFMRR